MVPCLFGRLIAEPDSILVGLAVVTTPSREHDGTEMSALQRIDKAAMTGRTETDRRHIGHLPFVVLSVHYNHQGKRMLRITVTLCADLCVGNA